MSSVFSFDDFDTLLASVPSSSSAGHLSVHSAGSSPSGESTPFMLPGFALVTGGGSGGLGGSGKKPVGIS